MDERLSKFLNDPKLVALSVGIVSFGAGAGVGYFVSQRRRPQLHLVPSMKEPFSNYDVDADMRQREQEAKNAEKLRHPASTVLGGVVLKQENEEEPKLFPDPAIDINKAKEFIKERLEKPLPVENTVVGEASEAEPFPRSIFTTTEDEWDWHVENEKRKTAQIYILHKDEFYADQKNYSQTTLTYYSGDDILVDEEDAPVYNHAQVVGPLIFGHGSGDQNVFHVRNEKLKAEYEILLDQGLYSVEVLGLDIENNARVEDLKHSSTLRKYKLD